MEYKVMLNSYGNDTIEKKMDEMIIFETGMTGEGIVWTSIPMNSRLTFKIKGEEHKSSSTKVKVPVDIERVNSIKELVEGFLTESRLNQGLEQLRMVGKDIDRKNLGFYLKWVQSDIIKEELDTIMGNGFEPNDVNGAISNGARLWFFQKEMGN